MAGSPAPGTNWFVKYGKTYWPAQVTCLLCVLVMCARVVPLPLHLHITPRLSPSLYIFMVLQFF